MTGGAWSGTGTLILGVPGEYELIEVTGDLVEVRTFRRELPEERPSSKDLQILREQMEEAFAASGVNVPDVAVDGLLEERADEPKNPLVLGVVEVDGEGRVWVLTTRRRDGEARVDVFAATGEFLQTLALPGRPQGLAFDEDRLFVLTRQDDGRDTVFSYRVAVAN